jgi:hypothetical protein
MNNRLSYLHSWASHLHRAIESGAFGPDIHLTEIKPVNGPRAGALEMLAGVGVGRLLTAFNRDRTALLRQYIPWQFTGTRLADRPSRAQDPSLLTWPAPAQIQPMGGGS